MLLTKAMNELSEKVPWSLHDITIRTGGKGGGGAMQRWIKSLMILRRYQLKLQMTSVKKRKQLKSKKSK